MADNKLALDSLLDSPWQVLRVELVEWDDCEGGTNGFDGLTRYWCSDAVFEVYWVAEQTIDDRYHVYLTEDIELAGFNSVLASNASLKWKQALAEHLAWRESAVTALTETIGTQLKLFEE